MLTLTHNKNKEDNKLGMNNMGTMSMRLPSEKNKQTNMEDTEELLNSSSASGYTQEESQEVCSFHPMKNY